MRGWWVLDDDDRHQEVPPARPTDRPIHGDVDDGRRFDDDGRRSRTPYESTHYDKVWPKGTTDEEARDMFVTYG